MAPSHNCILPHALKLSSSRKLAGKRLVLASASPRRVELLRAAGYAPEVVPSNFAEDLPVHAFPDPHEYPVATATQKAIEVYERLVAENPEDAPELVIGADTVVLTLPPEDAEVADNWRPDVLEKPMDKEDQRRMLLDLNGRVCEVVTGVTIAPGYQTRSIDERTKVYFVDHSPKFIDAYVASGEGIDRAGGFAIQGTGGLLVSKIDGDYANVVGFPTSSFVTLVEMLAEEDDDFLAD